VTSIEQCSAGAGHDLRAMPSKNFYVVRSGCSNFVGYFGDGKCLEDDGFGTVTFR
jgi:hypothetical protein